MRFDDRLATVLSQPVGSPHDRAVRWRQLVDLVARSNGHADRALLGQAIELIRTDRPSIREPIRAAAARSIAGSPIPLALLTVFAADKLAVAAPLIASASLTGEALGDLRAAASPDVRRFLDSLSRPATDEPSPAPAPNPTPEADPIPSISDVVARIEQLRMSREAAHSEPSQPSPSAPPPAPVADPTPRTPDYPVPALFRWECGAGGEIEWVEGAPRGPLIGRSIAVADPDEGVDDCVERAFVIRAPFRDCLLELGDDGLMAGEWQISGAPAFAPGDGRFIGYRGIARRGQAEPEPLPVRPAGRMPSGPRCASRDDPRDQDAAQCDYRLCRNHRRPVFRPRPQPLSRARGGDRDQRPLVARSRRGSRFRRPAAIGAGQRQRRDRFRQFLSRFCRCPVGAGRVAGGRASP